MSPARRVVVVFVPAIAFLALLTYGLVVSAPSSIEVGDRVDDVGLPLLGGGEIDTGDLRGRSVVINFWASWCVPCRDEAELLERTYRRYRDDGVVFLGVNIKDSESEARAFVDEFDISYPVARDVDESFADSLGVSGIPETFFVDAEGRFVGTASGGAQAEREGIVVLGPVNETALSENIEILLRRAGP